jgi:hypothetical protein
MRKKKSVHIWVWWCEPVFPVPGEAEAGGCEFKASLGYIVRPHFK